MRAERTTSSAITTRPAMTATRPTTTTANGGVSPSAGMARWSMDATCSPSSAKRPKKPAATASVATIAAWVTPTAATIASTPAGIRTTALRIISPTSPASTPWVTATNANPTINSPANCTVIAYGPPLPENQADARFGEVAVSKNENTARTVHTTPSRTQSPADRNSAEAAASAAPWAAPLAASVIGSTTAASAITPTPPGTAG